MTVAAGGDTEDATHVDTSEQAEVLVEIEIRDGSVAFEIAVRGTALLHAPRVSRARGTLIERQKSPGITEPVGVEVVSGHREGIVADLLLEWCRGIAVQLQGVGAEVTFSEVRQLDQLIDHGTCVVAIVLVRVCMIEGIVAPECNVACSLCNITGFEGSYRGFKIGRKF